jgi:hypothetical protein
MTKARITKHVVAEGSIETSKIVSLALEQLGEDAGSGHRPCLWITLIVPDAEGVEHEVNLQECSVRYKAEWTEMQTDTTTTTGDSTT